MKYQSDDRTELNKALIQFQKKIPVIAKNENGRFAYASFDRIIELTKHELNDLGIMFEQPIEILDGKNVLITRLIHVESAQFVQSAMILRECPSNQEMGMNLTYMRRYSYNAILSLVVDKDDDAEAEQERLIKERKEKESKPATEDAPQKYDPEDLVTKKAIEYTNKTFSEKSIQALLKKYNIKKIEDLKIGQLIESKNLLIQK